MKNFDDFISSWQDKSGAKDLLCSIHSLANELGLTADYIARPGVSHSLRLGVAQSKRPFFAMADVIDDTPEERWLSICMYADVAVDPDERGDLVPKGLNNQDAVCFDLDEPSDEDKAYILQVIKNATAKEKA